MIRGTTPTFSLTIASDEIDLTFASNVYATFKQDKVCLTKTGEDIEVLAKRVDVYLTQAETLQFHAGTLSIQLNWTYTDGSRMCTYIASVNVGENLVGCVLQ